MPIVRTRYRPKQPLVDFLDVGFGRGERIAMLARVHKNKRFLGIERERGAIIPSRQHNTKLALGNAIKKLRQIPSESVKIINMDFFPFVKIKRELDITSPTRMVFTEEVKQSYPGLLKQVKRVLKTNGRFYITVPAGGISAIDTILALNRLDYEMAAVPVSKKNVTDSMREHFEMSKSDPMARPWRVVVVKRAGKNLTNGNKTRQIR